MNYESQGSRAYIKGKERAAGLAKKELDMVHASNGTLHDHVRLPSAKVVRMEYQRAQSTSTV